MFDYNGKNILAPMVRIGTLPTRLLALECGADLVYSEELIDYRLLKCRRIKNVLLGSVDFVDTDNRIIYRTCAKERGRNIIQIGTCSPERAVQVALMVQKDVAGIDVNMGCPKEFSIKGGMGAALLTQPDMIEAILCALLRAVPHLLVTCKVRVFDDVEATIKLCQRIEATGVHALGIHGRTRDERPQHSNRNSTIRAVAEALNIPVIANGGSSEISRFVDLERFRNVCNAAAVMVARSAGTNVSIFCKEGMWSTEKLVTRYLRLAIEWDNRFTNTKYCIQHMLGSQQVTTEQGRKLLQTRCMEDVCDIWGLRQTYEDKQAHWHHEAQTLRVGNEERGLKRKLNSSAENEGEVFEIEVKFCRNLFGIADLPKTLLFNRSRAEKGEQPRYTIMNVDKMFRAVVLYNGKRYSSLFREKNKRMAEQSAALACLYALGVIGEEKIRGDSRGKMTDNYGKNT
ncbi:tRNA-dihydrouridine(20) synthase-like [Tropilaelaps mercedesae]|uniref:tRNA-dihydrouridine(20) synthase-like n=1 Tax=Tropilaelaps mercedesae TaxID=418985 RepID=A0A1V9Y3Y6_9ACAR|nr:tRNA-dihydrouridine(20) synthase-like [Tropilaelaps mercedesae]